ncbi:MAG: hypothetical protein KDC85_20520 [Saprospiraceae bacterium]|nr:hypothetical protein [Saprospiraceae bacterium]MCB9322763.1 hypothetical protein [Lewinellaceae bacterium]
MKRRSIWPGYRGPGGVRIIEPQHQSNFTENLKKTWKMTGHLPKPKKRKWIPPIPAYPRKALFKQWGIIILLTGVVCWYVVTKYF